MKKKNNKKWTLVLVLLLVVSIGYASLASNLKINGTSGVKSATWDVYWNNVQVTQGSVETAQGNQARITDQAKTQVEYSVVLNEPGDFYEFTVDAVNSGTIDAMIASEGIVNGVYSDANYQNEVTLPKTVSYTVTYADGTTIEPKHLLAKKTNGVATTETYKVRIEYRNDDEIDADDLDENDQTYYFKFSVNYVQADGTAEPSHQASAISITRQNPGQITPGDLVEIGDTEDFYVISSNSEKTVLLAKSNLLVGYSNNESTNYEDTYVSPSTPGYGLQSVDAIGYVAGYNYSTVAFSSTNYWDPDESGLISPYNANGASYDGTPKPFVYNSSLTTAPDFENDGWNTSGYSIAHYVEQYVTALKGMGAPSTITGRLLTFEEATSPSIGCDADEYTCPQDSFITDTSFWFGSVYDGSGVWDVGSNGDLDNNYYNYSYYGVRPVIEIPTSELQ